MSRLRQFVSGGVLLLLALPGLLMAGQTCSEKPPTPEVVQKALRLALDTRNRLEASGASVALIGRAGQNLSAYGLKYSHASLVWRDHPKGRWFLVHELNLCGTDRSALYDEGLGNFFLDDLYAFDAVIVVPSKDTQDHLIKALRDPLAASLHEPRYSTIAAPFNTRYQNSNQWLLETLAAALAPQGTVADRNQAQDWLRSHGYHASVIAISPLQRVGAGLLRANVHFDDHGLEERLEGRYQVVSVESVIDFLRQLDPAVTQQELRLD